mmetsp:Transcript_29536/g.59354  ORF Transcript_29536/g.59354 Transcript_29536/m.59354 type:complete len:213 (+) Transcript_29536:445-1083(+)
MTIRSQMVCVFPFTPAISSAGNGAVNAKKGRAKLTNAFLCNFSGRPFRTLTNSRQESDDTRAVVVIMAGTILPATRRVSIASAGTIPYARARRLLAAVTNATWPLDSSSFSKSAKLSSGRRDAPVLAPFNFSKTMDSGSFSPSFSSDESEEDFLVLPFLYSNKACSSNALKASSKDTKDCPSDDSATGRKDSIRSLAAECTNWAIRSFMMIC